MSFLTRIALRSRASPLRLTPISTRPFHITSARAALSESDHDQDVDDRKATIDHHKDDQLNKQKDGKGHWKSELGSNSESAVRTFETLWRNGNLEDCKITVRDEQLDADELGKRQIKADREEITDTEHDIEGLQKETSEAMEDDHDHAKK